MEQCISTEEMMSKFGQSCFNGKNAISETCVIDVANTASIRKVVALIWATAAKYRHTGRHGPI